MTEPVFRSTLRLSSGASTDAFGLSRLGETRGFLKMLVDAQSDRILGFGAGRRRERDRAEVDHGKYSLR